MDLAIELTPRCKGTREGTAVFWLLAHHEGASFLAKFEPWVCSSHAARRQGQTLQGCVWPLFVPFLTEDVQECVDVGWSLYLTASVSCISATVMTFWVMVSGLKAGMVAGTASPPSSENEDFWKRSWNGAQHRCPQKCKGSRQECWQNQFWHLSQNWCF